MGCCTSHLACDWLVVGPWGAEAPAQSPEGTEGNLDG